MSSVVLFVVVGVHNGQRNIDHVVSVRGASVSMINLSKNFVNFLLLNPHHCIGLADSCDNGLVYFATIWLNMPTIGTADHVQPPSTANDHWRSARVSRNAGTCVARRAALEAGAGRG